MRTKIVSSYLRILVVGSLVIASAAWSDVAGNVTAVTGKAEIQSAGKGSWQQIKLDDDVAVGDHLRTAAGSTLTVSYRDGSEIALDPDSELVVDDQTLPAGSAKVSLFSLDRGKAAVSVPKGTYNQPGARFEVKTTTAVAGVRGTKFTIEAE